MEKGRTLMLAAAAIGIVGVTALAILPRPAVVPSKGEESAYAMSMSSAGNKLTSSSSATSGDVTLNTESGGEVAFAYSGAKSGASSWQILESGGYFQNTDPIHGIKSMTLAFNTIGASYKIYYSGDDGLGTSETLSSAASTTYTFDDAYPNYFKIENVSGADLEISSIAIAHTCSDHYYSLSLSSENSYGSVSGTSGELLPGASCTVVASANDSCVFGGWYSGDTRVSSDASYTFTMPSSDYALTAHFESDASWDENHGVSAAVSGSTVTYGLYPQTVVSDSSLLTALNSLGDAYVNSDNGWYLYDYEFYAKVAATPNDSSYTFNNGTTIVSGTTYWFKCEPITWKALTSSGSSYYLLSSVVLDTHRFDDDSNNYADSEIRAWLNDDFYDLAFNLHSSYVSTTTVDNSKSTTNSSSNTYACSNTSDKVFLLSWQDYLNSSYGFSTSTSGSTTRLCVPTDYARAVGAYLENNYSFYWTRSPHTNGEGKAGCVYSQDGRLTDGSVGTTWRSVRPAINITLA